MRWFCFAFVTMLGIVSGTLRIASAADGPGSLLVESDPAGAAVYVDGQPAGETPLKIASIASGVHRVRVVRLGFLENSRVVTIKPGVPATVRARLTDPAPQTAGQAALKIVVLEGEGAVNIIQQKTAVAPVIEVRDRNDQPVSGAVVKFAISKGKASFDGARTLSVTTNAAGRATATGFTATAKGTLQIATSAAFQGQTAAATIAQTTVATAAEATSLASGAGVAGAGGGGGGLSTTTLAIVGGAVAGGAIVTKELRGGSEVVYRGSFSGVLVDRITNIPGVTCLFTTTQNGIVEITLTSSDGDPVSGTGRIEGTTALAPGSPTCGVPSATTPQTGGCCSPAPQVSGTRSNLTFSGSHPGNAGTNWTYEFAGAFEGTQIVGTYTLTMRSPNESGQSVFPVTLQRQ